jgi:hypothetical protein
MGMLARGAALLAKHRLAANGHSGTYVRRKTGARVAIEFGLGSAEVDLDTYDTASVTRRPVDFLVEATALRTTASDASTQFVPEVGDVIESSHTGTAREYLVSPEFGEPHFIPHNARASTWRIHTKEKS